MKERIAIKGNGMWFTVINGIKWIFKEKEECERFIKVFANENPPEI